MQLPVGTALLQLPLRLSEVELLFSPADSFVLNYPILARNLRLILCFLFFLSSHL